MRKSKIFALLLVSALTFQIKAEGVYDAVGAAAEKTINQMTASAETAGIKSIAFLGFKNDRNLFDPEFRAALSANPGRFSFYTRNEDELGRLAEEIEFGEKRADIMKSETIQKFGRVNGVQAFLYGRIIEKGRNKNGYYVFKVSLTLSEIETGRDIWGGIVTGVYRPQEELKTATPEVTKAAIDAGKQLNNKLQLAKHNLPESNIFILPFLGKDAGAVSNIIISEIDEHSDGKIAVYANTRLIDSLDLDDINADVNGNMATLSSRQLKNLSEKLINEYNINPKAMSGGKYGDSKVNTYLQGTITNVYMDDKDNTQKLIINVQIRNLKNNKLMWSETVEGEYELPLTSEQEITKLWKDNKMLIMIGGGIIALLIIVILIMTFSRSMSRVR